MNGILLIFMIACLLLILCGGDYLGSAIFRHIEHRRKRKPMRDTRTALERAESECEALRAENAKLRRKIHMMQSDAESRIDELEREITNKNKILAQKWACSRREA